MLKVISQEALVITPGVGFARRRAVTTSNGRGRITWWRASLRSESLHRASRVSPARSSVLQSGDLFGLFDLAFSAFSLL